MKIVSTTITNARSDVIGTALAAIPRDVDQCLVIDTGADRETLRLAREVLGERMALRSFAWVGDFSAARNFALDCAREAGADWSLTADTDETLALGAPGELRAFLSSVPDEVAAVMVRHSSDSFGQPRLIRLPTALRWQEPVHEYLPIDIAANAPKGWQFACQDRPQEDRAAKYRGYARILERRVLEAPGNARAWYYLGDTLAILGRHREALDGWARRLDLVGGNPFEAAWSGWRAAILCRQHPELGAPEPWLLRGLMHDANHSESMWLLGHFAFERGDRAAARVCCERALASGVRERGGSFCFRRGQRELPAALIALLDRDGK